MTVLDRFRSVVRAYCDRERGRRAQIARACFGESWRNRMSDVALWLDGKREPSAIHILDILLWLPARVRARIWANSGSSSGSTQSNSGSKKQSRRSFLIQKEYESSLTPAEVLELEKLQQKAKRRK